MRRSNFIPPILKFKRYHKMPLQILKYNAYTTKLHHGFCGLKVQESGFLTPKQIEIVRRLIVRVAGKRRNKKKARI